MLLVNTEIKIMKQDFDFGSLYKTDIGEFGENENDRKLTSRPMNIIVPDPETTSFVEETFFFSEENGSWYLKEGIYPDLVVRATSSGAPKIVKVSDPEVGFKELYLLITTNVEDDKKEWKNSFRNGAVYGHILSLDKDAFSILSSSTNFGTKPNKKTGKVSRWDAVLLKVESFMKEDSVIRVHYVEKIFADDYIIINKNGKIAQISDENLAGDFLGSALDNYGLSKGVGEGLNDIYRDTALKVDAFDWKPLSRRNLPKTILPEKKKPEPKKFDKPRRFNNNKKFNKNRNKNK